MDALPQIPHPGPAPECILPELLQLSLGLRGGCAGHISMQPPVRRNPIPSQVSKRLYRNGNQRRSSLRVCFDLLWQGSLDSIARPVLPVRPQTHCPAHASYARTTLRGTISFPSPVPSYPELAAPFLEGWLRCMG